MALIYEVGKDYKTDNGLKVTCVFVGVKYAAFVTDEGQAINAPTDDDAVFQPLGKDSKSIVAEFKDGTQHDSYIAVNKSSGFVKTVYDTLQEAQQQNPTAYMFAHLYFDEDTGKIFAEFIEPK